MDLLPGVTWETITPPPLPSIHLPRPELLSFLNQDAPKALIIMAPVGFGKTTLAAEWAAANLETVWFESTPQDDIRTTLHRMICAIRRVIPGFASWYSPQSNLESRLEEILKQVTAEIGELGRPLNFVLDSLEKMPASNARFVQIWTDNLPLNVRTLSLRRNAPLLSYERAVELGVLKYFAAFDVRFKDDQILALKGRYGIDTPDDELLKSIHTLNGWPAGVITYLESLALINGANKSALSNEYILRFVTPELQEVVQSKSELLKLGTQNLVSALERAAYPGFTIRGRSMQALTARELEILRMLNSDRTIERIAADLFISINTLKSHLKSVYRKLEAGNRDEAVLRGHENSLI